MKDRNRYFAYIFTVIFTTFFLSSIAHAANPFSISSRDDLDNWLYTQPKFRNAIIFRDLDNNPRSYSAWSSAEKQDLVDAIAAYSNGISFDVPSPAVSNIQSSRIYYAQDDVWRIYIAHVAQSLQLQINNVVPWRLNENDPSVMSMFFDSEAYFIGNGDSYNGYYVNQSQQGSSLPGDPHFVFQFLRTNNLLGTSENDTITRVLEWGKQNLIHSSSQQTDGDMSQWQLHWHTAGYPTARLVLEGTVRVGDSESKHWTYGCHGTVGFLRSILRAVNIPVAYLTPGAHPTIPLGHAQAHFVSEGLFLGHGDDPYALRSYEQGESIPAWELLIDEPAYQARFGASLDALTKYNNVSIQPLIVAVKYLSPKLQSLRCADIANSLSNQNGELFALLQRAFTFEQLNNADFWNALDNKIAHFGLCTVPPGQNGYIEPEVELYEEDSQKQHAIIDTSYYYRLTNSFLNSGRSLDTYSNGNNQPFMGNTGNYSGQFWQLIPLDNGYYRLINTYLGIERSLDTYSGSDNALFMGETGNYSGQLWRITPIGNGYYRLSNSFLGDSRSLDTYSGTSNAPFMGETGNYSGQMWVLTRLHRVQLRQSHDQGR